MSKEPVAIWGVIAAIIVSFLARYNITWIDSVMVETFLSAAAVIVGAWLARRKVIPVATVNEAGLTSADVKNRAASPSFTPVIE